MAAAKPVPKAQVTVLDFDKLGEENDLKRKLYLIRAAMSNGLSHKIMKEKMANKTIGVMKVQFEGEDNPVYIGAVCQELGCQMFGWMIHLNWLNP